MYELTSEQQARAFSRAVFVDGEISLGEFMARLAEYGDALLAQAQRDAEAVARLTAALAAAEAARDLYVTKITELSGRLANMERGA